jgi:tetratricopeptide (TPR) repeat protein
MNNNIQDSKNIVTGHIDAKGNVIVGDNIVINLKEAAQYITLEKAIENLEERLNKTISKIKKYPDDADFRADLIQIDKERNERQQELETLKMQVLELAKTFEKIDLDTERLQKAKFHFDKGEFKEARAVLDAEIMTKELSALLDKKEQLKTETTENDKNLSDKADEFLILAQLTAIAFDLKDRFEKTIQYFEKSLQAERNVKNSFAFAYFLQEHKQNNKATPLYEEALANYRQLAEVNSQTYLPYVAGTLNNLANLQSAKNEFAKAELSYEEALAIRRQLAEVNPQTFLQDVATTLNNLGLLQSAKNEFAKAELSYEEALAIKRQLAEVNPQTFLQDVATTLNNLGILQSAKNEFAKAEKSYEEALAIRRQLAEMNPQTFLPNLAMTQINMAIFYLESKPNKARSFELVDEAIMILLPFLELGYIQNYLKVAFQILAALGIDKEAYLKEKGMG